MQAEMRCRAPDGRAPDAGTNPKMSEQKRRALRKNQRETATRRGKLPCNGRVPSVGEQVALAQGIGARLREAREIAGMSQTRAAFLLGYSNSSKLAKVEAGMEGAQSPIRTIPLWLLRKASMIYQVSLDYLFGITETMESDEPRHDAQRELIILMREEWERQRWRDMLVTRAIQERVTALDDALRLLAEQAEQAEQAMERARDLAGEDWQDLPGGARLERTVASVAASARTATEKLYRLRRESRDCTGGAQMELDLIYG